MLASKSDMQRLAVKMSVVEWRSDCVKTMKTITRLAKVPKTMPMPSKTEKMIATVRSIWTNLVFAGVELSDVNDEL